MIARKTPAPDKTPDKTLDIAPQASTTPEPAKATSPTEAMSTPATTLNQPPAPVALEAKGTQIPPISANPSPSIQATVPPAGAGTQPTMFTGAVQPDADNTGPAAPPTTAPTGIIPPDLMIRSPLVDSATLAPLEDPDDRVIHPLTPSPWAILQHYTPQETQLTRIWVGAGAPPADVKPWKPTGVVARSRGG